MAQIRGKIFLSHANVDKDVVDPVYRLLDRGNVFYDIKTIAPGQNTLAAMREGIAGSAVFVLFHSPETETEWVRFEAELGEIAKIKSRDLQILVVPVRGATYRSLPEWLQRFMTLPSEAKPNDIVRTIQFLYEESLKLQVGGMGELVVGREDLERKVSVEIMQRPAKTGKPLNVIIVTCIQGIGRTTFARQLLKSAFQTSRPAGPIFELSTAADAVDWHLRIFEDLEGGLSPESTERQIVAFSALGPEDQADTLCRALEHWGRLNQVVIVRVRRGLRDRGQQLRPWLDRLFRNLGHLPQIRLVIVSDRRIPEESLIMHENVKQVALEELQESDIEYILSRGIDAKFQQSAILSVISRSIHGHPATANYVIKLVNSGKSLDSLALLPNPIYQFQDSLMSGMFADDLLSIDQKRILTLLCHLPQLSVAIMHEAFPEIAKEDLAAALWDLNESSLIDQAERGLYKAPAVVASSYRRHTKENDVEIFERVARLLKAQFDSGTLALELIESLVVSAVERGDGLAPELVKVVTPSNLLPVVESEYYRGVRAEGDARRDHFKNAANIARLAQKMPGSDDTLEELLFFGADALVRMGDYPDEFLQVMRKKAFSSADYIEGSYLFHNKRDYTGAAKKLRASLASSNFKLRKTRLLARVYLRDGKFVDTIEILSRINEQRLLSDTGLAVMMLKALRGTRSYPEANALERKIKEERDDYGELAIYRAGSALKDGKLSEAMRFIKVAEGKDSNKVTVKVLKCAIAVEQGVKGDLAEVCALARAANRDADAWQLQARAALADHDWRSASEFLSYIDNKDYFDLSIEMRMLDMKMADLDVVRNPVLFADSKARKDQILVRLSKSTDRFGL